MLTIHFAVVLLGIHPREIKYRLTQKQYVNVQSSLIILTAPNWKQPKCTSTGEWIKTLRYIHVHGLRLSNNKELTIDVLNNWDGFQRNNCAEKKKANLNMLHTV